MKKNTHFLFLSVRNNILPTIFVLFTISLVIFSKENLSATKNGLLLWANSVVPSLLPFFIATELLSHTNVVSFIGKLLNKWMKPIFNVPGAGAYAFIMGIISGYPVGAKIVTEFRKNGICTKAEAERLLSFTNNSGPLFIIGTVGITMFGNSLIGLLLFATHVIAGFIVGILFRFWKYNDKETLIIKNISSSSKDNVTFSNLGEILSTSIMNAINTVTMIGGFVILFSVVISILSNSGLLHVVAKVLYPIFNIFNFDISYIEAIISGIIELTNGLSKITQINAKSISSIITISSFLLGFGGLSILLQVLSITSKSDISIKPYIIGKILHATIACILTYSIIHIFPIFNLDLAPIVSQNVNKLPTTLAFLNPYNILIFILIFITTGFILVNRKKCNINNQHN